MKNTFLILFFSTYFTVLGQVPKQPERNNADSELSIEVIDKPVERTMAGYYQEKGKYGFVYPKDTRQEAIYDKISSASTGFIVKKGNLFGLADKTGMPIGKIEFDSIGTTYDNSYIVKKKNLYGSMSEDGKLLLSIKYNKILFSESKNPISFVKEKNGEVQMIFNEKEKLYSQKFDYTELYSNLVIVKSNGKFGVLKKETIIPFEYDSIFVPLVDTYPYQNNRKIITKKLKPFTFDYSKSQKNINLLAVQKNAKIGLINSEGSVVYPTDNDAVKNVEMLHYYTVKKDNLYGIYFIDSKKKTEIEFDNVYADGIGYVMAVKNKKTGVFNLKGEQIVPFEYDPDFIAQLSGIGFRVSKDKKRGIIDTKGNVMVPPIYDDVDTFYENGFTEFIKVKSGEKYGIVNLKGNVIIPVEFEWIGEENGLFKVATSNPDRKLGLYSKDGKVIIPAEYRWITHSETPDSQITILVKDNHSYNFLTKKNELVFSENIIEYGYVLNQNRLLNPDSATKNYLLYVKEKNGKIGLLNEVTGTIDTPMEYDQIIQCFESRKHKYFSVRKGKKFGLINEKNKVIIPLNYDAVSLDLISINLDDETDENYLVVVKKGNKYGALNLKNEIQIPFQYSELQRISRNGFYKAKNNNQYQIINSKNNVLNKGPFDEVANFEDANDYYQALTFSNGKMKVINDKGQFISSEVVMQPHKGYTTFDELKFELIRALDSKENVLLKDFAEKIAPSQHLLYYLKQNLFDNTSLKYTNIDFIKEKYYNDLLKFKSEYWNENSSNRYHRAILTEITDYTLYQNDYITNVRSSEKTYGNTRFMEKLLRNAVKIDGFWISSYFMIRNFND